MTDPHAYFNEATATLDPPDVDALVTGGLRRGRERRRRRQVLTTVAAGASVAVLAVGAVAVPRMLDAEVDSVPLEPAAPGKARAVDPPAPTEPRELAVKPKDVPMVFADLIGGTAVEDVSYLSDHGGVIAHLRWNGAYTSVFVDGFLEDRSPLEECRALSGPGMECTERPDGSVEQRWQEQQPLQDGGTTGRGLSLYTTDGWSLGVISYNAADPKSSEQTSPEPPISYEQMEQVVTSDVWFR